jgi:hypothetical protein
MSNNSKLIKEIAKQIAAGVQSFNEQSAKEGSGARAIKPSHFELDGITHPIKNADTQRKPSL